MPKTNEEILEAVRALDANNDEHWTADGMPRLDAVENLLGDSVTRKSVTNAAPDFTRSVARELVDVDDDGEPPVDEPPVEGADETPAEDETDESAKDESTEDEADQQSPEASDETDDETASNDEDDQDDPLAEGPADLEAEMDAEIDEARQRIEHIQQKLAEGKQVLAEAEEELGRLIDAKNREFPPMSPAEAIQRFQRSEQAKRAAARGASLGPSPLDAAMSARRKVRRQGAPE